MNSMSAASGIQSFERRLRERALQRHQRRVDPVDVQIGAQRAQQRQVVFAIARVDHHAHLVAQVDQHQVVLDAALVVEQHRIALQSGRPAFEVDRQRSLELLVQGVEAAVARGDGELAHVRDIEQSRLRPGVQMFGLQPCRVLDGHVPAGEARHLGAQLAVQRIERHVGQGGVCVVCHAVSPVLRRSR
jgi:hypothetical protein